MPTGGPTSSQHHSRGCDVDNSSISIIASPLSRSRLERERASPLHPFLSTPTCSTKELDRSAVKRSHAPRCALDLFHQRCPSSPILVAVQPSLLLSSLSLSLSLVRLARAETRSRNTRSRPPCAETKRRVSFEVSRARGHFSSLPLLPPILLLTLPSQSQPQSYRPADCSKASCLSKLLYHKPQSKGPHVIVRRGSTLSLRQNGPLVDRRPFIALELPRQPSPATFSAAPLDYLWTASSITLSIVFASSKAFCAPPSNSPLLSLS